MSNKPKEITAVYDLGDESEYADRYTILFSKKDFPEVSKPQYVQSLGMSGNPDHPQGVSQWGEALPGSHLGKKIKWDSLPDNIKTHIIKRLSNDNESHIKLRRSCNRSMDIIRLAEEDASSYFVLADPKEADKIVKSGKDDKAIFKGTADDAAKYAKDKLAGKETVMLQRDPHGKYKYTVSSSDKAGTTTHERKTGGNSMSRAKDITKLVESASVNEMYALGADHIVNFLKKTAYERFDVDPSTITVVPWPEDGSDFNIKSPLSKEQYEELSEKITRNYPLYVVEFIGDGVMKFYSGRSVGDQGADTLLPYPREGGPETNSPGKPTGEPNPLGREKDWVNLDGRTGYDL